MDGQGKEVLSEEERRKLSQILGEPVTQEQFGVPRQNQVNQENPVNQGNFADPQSQEPSLRNIVYVLIVILILIAALVKGYLYVSEQARLTLQSSLNNIPPSPTAVVISPTIEATPSASESSQL